MFITYIYPTLPESSILDHAARKQKKRTKDQTCLLHMTVAVFHHQGCGICILNIKLKSCAKKISRLCQSMSKALGRSFVNERNEKTLADEMSTYIYINKYKKNQN